MKNHFMQKLVKITCFLSFILPFSSQALEGAVQWHKSAKEDLQGYSIGITDSFIKNHSLNWGVSYNHLENIFVNWNNEDIDFSLNTVDIMLSYRYYPKFYNSSRTSLSYEFQAGVGVIVTENKFTWTDLNEEKYFSEIGDTNTFLAFIAHKKISRNTSVQFGVKHYIEHLEFSDISSVFLGLTYKFGR